MSSGFRYLTILALCGSLGSCVKPGQRQKTETRVQTIDIARNPPSPQMGAQTTMSAAPESPNTGSPKPTAAPVMNPDPSVIGPMPPEEGVDPPANISGVLLYVHCSFEAFANDNSQDSLLGCRIDDQAGKRRPASSLAPSFTYDYKLPDFADLKIFPRILDRDSRYDVLYLLKGKPTIEMAQQVAKMVINAVLKGTEAEKDVVVKGVLANILRNANSLPEQRDADYTKLIEQILADAQAGVATPIPVDALPQDATEKGQRLYAQFCLSCHDSKGKGPTQPIKDNSGDSIAKALNSVTIMSQTNNMVTREEVNAIAAYLQKP